MGHPSPHQMQENPARQTQSSICVRCHHLLLKLYFFMLLISLHFGTISDINIFIFVLKVTCETLGRINLCILLVKYNRKFCFLFKNPQYDCLFISFNTDKIFSMRINNFYILKPAISYADLTCTFVYPY